MHCTALKRTMNWYAAAAAAMGIATFNGHRMAQMCCKMLLFRAHERSSVSAETVPRSMTRVRARREDVCALPATQPTAAQQDQFDSKLVQTVLPSGPAHSADVLTMCIARDRVRIRFAWKRQWQAQKNRKALYN